MFFRYKHFKPTYLLLFIITLIITEINALAGKQKIDKTKCPKVRATKSLNFDQIIGPWYVIEYYASSEESIIYRCMRSMFSIAEDNFEIIMKFTYSYIDDPDNEILNGNITWRVPDFTQPAHWIHAEDTYEGVYNTYILDIETNGEKSWALLLHCAEKNGTSRYLSSFIIAQKPHLPVNVLSFLRSKLTRYDIDLQYMFEMDQKDCYNENQQQFLPIITTNTKTKTKKHPMQHNHG